MKNLAVKVQRKLENQEFLSLSEAKCMLSKGYSGFYWIYTKLSLDNFLHAERPPRGSSHIDFSKMAEIHQNLCFVIPQSVDNFWCIYNGKATDIKKRLVQEFTDSSPTTGKLALLRCFCKKDFAVKFIICESSDELYGIGEKYNQVEGYLERVWRLNCGWPFLCSQ